MHWSALLILLAALFLLVNWMVQAFYKPSEVVGLAEAPFFKLPKATWSAYGPLFKRHATSICTPDFLAALAQAESSGNPIARTHWVWRWSLNPFKIYRPASSSTGMYQMTDGTFEAARRYCIHRRKVFREGKWYDPNSCWYNGLYNRLVPSHAIEMTSAYLHVQTQSMDSGVRKPLSLRQRQRIAALIHICGAAYARSYVQSGWRLPSSPSCGGQQVEPYLRKVAYYSFLFRELRAAAEGK